MNVAAQRSGGAGDDGQAQPGPGTLSGAANERYEQGVCHARGKASTLVLHFDDKTIVQASCTYVDVSRFGVYFRPFCTRFDTADVKNCRSVTISRSGSTSILRL